MLQHILCLSFMGGPLWPTRGDPGLPMSPAGGEGGRKQEVPRVPAEGFPW